MSAFSDLTIFSSWFKKTRNQWSEIVSNFDHENDSLMDALNEFAAKCCNELPDQIKSELAALGNNQLCMHPSCEVPMEVIALQFLILDSIDIDDCVLDCGSIDDVSVWAELDRSPKEVANYIHNNFYPSNNKFIVNFIVTTNNETNKLFLVKAPFDVSVKEISKIVSQKHGLEPLNIQIDSNESVEVLMRYNLLSELNFNQ